MFAPGFKTQLQNISARLGEGNHTIFHYLIYALINVIIAVPGLYGYASVIFNHPAFQPHMNALAKLVIFSSFVHQLGFTLFSSLSFAIGTVQDAGLIFLSAMSNSIAEVSLVVLFFSRRLFYECVIPRIAMLYDVGHSIIDPHHICLLELKFTL